MNEKTVSKQEAEAAVVRVWERMAADLRAAGYEPGEIGEGGQYQVGGSGSFYKVAGVRVELRVEPEYVSDYRYGPGRCTGKVVVRVGSRRRYVVSAEAGNFSGICSAILEQVKEQKAKEEAYALRERKHAESTEVLKRLEASGIAKYGKGYHLTVEKGALKFVVSERVTEEQARALAEAVGRILGTG